MSGRSKEQDDFGAREASAKTVGRSPSVCGDRRIHFGRVEGPSSFLQIASQDVAAIDPQPLPQERMSSPY